MNNQLKICLVGFMGAGKTTVAANLAELLDLAALDLDAVIERRQGLPVHKIIERFGEPEFRRIETAILSEVLRTEQSFVLALGGGAWTKAENRKLLNDYDCRTIWLDAEFELCWQRIETAKPARPLAPTKQRAQQLFAERQSVYQTAQIRISICAEQTPAEIARRICGKLNL